LSWRRLPSRSVGGALCSDPREATMARKFEEEGCERMVVRLIASLKTRRWWFEYDCVKLLQARRLKAPFGGVVWVTVDEYQFVCVTL